jgi:hypothetical protein
MKRTTVYLLFPILVFVLCVHVQCKKSAEIVSSGTVYFLVSEISHAHGDSYILPLTEQADITAAEAIINGSSTSMIVSARIDFGEGDGIYKNKDLLSSNGRVWSWHVVKFNGFVDVSAEIYDSWPTYIENNLDSWMQQNGGTIAFWGYTVSRKVSLSELK